jgi:hypothetical protein
MRADRVTRILLGFVGTGLWAVAMVSLTSRGLFAADGPADTLRVRRLDVVNERGELQTVIADKAHFPPITLDGKTYPKSTRSIEPNGIVFYDEDGNEAGGVGVYAQEKQTRQVLATLDYRNADGIGFGVDDRRPGRYSAGFFIRDPVALDADISKTGSTSTERIRLQNENGDASLVLRDAEGHVRIRLEVTRAGAASIQLLDETGRVIEQLPSTAKRG